MLSHPDRVLDNRHRPVSRFVPSVSMKARPGLVLFALVSLFFALSQAQGKCLRQGGVNKRVSTDCGLLLGECAGGT